MTSLFPQNMEPVKYTQSLVFYSTSVFIYECKTSNKQTTDGNISEHLSFYEHLCEAAAELQVFPGEEPLVRLATAADACWWVYLCQRTEQKGTELAGHVEFS